MSMPRELNEPRPPKPTVSRNTEIGRWVSSRSPAGAPGDAAASATRPRRRKRRIPARRAMRIEGRVRPFSSAVATADGQE